jgi:hypothetical protein
MSAKETDLASSAAPSSTSNLIRKSFVVGRIVVPVVLVVAVTNPAWSKSRDFVAATNTHEAIIAACVERASSRRNWLQQTLVALRREEAGWIGAEVHNEDGTYDLGPMQVNSWWVPRIARKIARSERQVRAWLRDDACFNVDAPRGIFRSALHDTRDFWKAVVSIIARRAGGKFDTRGASPRSSPAAS